MITKEEATQLAEGKLRELIEKSGLEMTFLYEETIEFQYGWMFFYQSTKYIETEDEQFLVGGNAPIIVDKYNASVHITGTRMDENFYIENYCKYRDDIAMFRKAIR